MRDHPRSRGVYRPDFFPIKSSVGSSPLARGLLAVHGNDAVMRRIIPARAGFTRPGWNSPAGVSDHPRSRGVYERVDGDVLSGGGIIPARAGFTRGARERCCHAADHPRSRGVYAFVERSHMWEWGSSPLARGLHDAYVALAGGLRIIPARAGFTVRPTVAPTPVRDHPRSRGVYVQPVLRTAWRRGSSPLARGLPDT